MNQVSMSLERNRRDTLRLLPYDEIRKKISNTISQIPLKTETVSIDNSLNRVAARTVRSKICLPPCDISAMDGYALKSENSEGTRLVVKGSIYPDSKPNYRINSFESYYVATGARIPKGADSVARVEIVRQDGDTITVPRGVEKGKDVARKGEDVKLGELLLSKGEIISPGKIAVLMQCRIRRVSVFKTPRVGILSIGDELTSFSKPARGRTVNDFAHLIHSFLGEIGINSTFLPIAGDNPIEIRNKIKQGIRALDLLITIGGTSVGERDNTLDALLDERSAVIFHGVRMVPIRPAGLVILDRNKPIILLPSHSVSVALAFFMIAVPVLNLMSGLRIEYKPLSIVASVSTNFENPRYLDSLQLVKVRNNEGEFVARPLHWGSNLVSTLAQANGFVQLKPKQIVGEGEKISVTLFSYSGLHSA